ncbi:Hypothetical protein NTJ_10397 [Nesidiocoris tenuis]|uniref:THAP-type domain-containing protein n=1 Tax=Nesidiocoris tenuis TaxID=355587 RepID=A0ABN7B034_9HEMI|nr:Hypothetical protein NTJ_10397 [Nesidiocoris tenuis]
MSAAGIRSTLIAPMGRCAFENCQHSKEPWAILHRFPTDSILRKKWLKSINRKGFRPIKTSRVCRAHFAYDSYVYGTNRLRQGAVPEPAEASIEIVTQTPLDGNKPERFKIVNDNQIDDDEESTDSEGADDSSSHDEGKSHKHVRLYTEPLGFDLENEPPENSYRSLPITKSSIMPADFGDLLAKAYPRRKLKQYDSINEGMGVRILPLPTAEDVLRRKLSMYRLKLGRRDETIERLKSQIENRRRAPLKTEYKIRVALK